MHIALKDVYAKTLTATEEEHAFLDKLLCVSQPGYQYMPAYKRRYPDGSRVWDGTKRFYSTKTGIFLTGFLPFVLEEAHKKGFQVTTTDERVPLPLPDPTSLRDHYGDLYDHQLDAVIRMATATLRSDNHVLPWHRGIIKFPPGTGKTRIAVSFLRFSQKKTLYLVQSQALLSQTAKVFRKHLDASIGLVGDKDFDLSGHVTIATVQMLQSRVKTDTSIFPFLSSIECLMIDECHHVKNGIYHTIATACSASVRFALSATPLQRGDLGDVMLIGTMGDMLVEGDAQRLASERLIAVPHIYLFDVTDPRMEGASYHTAYTHAIVENETRHALTVKAAMQLHKRGCTTLVLVNEIAHGHRLHLLLAEAGLRTIFLSGQDDTSLREEVLASLGQGWDVLVATRILDEGVDMPHLDGLIIAAGGKMPKRTIQRIGRVLRPKPPHNKAYVVDFVDRTNRYLLAHSESRVATYDALGYKITKV